MISRLRRKLKFWWQRRTRGWDDRDTWNLDIAISEFVIPRLERFRELTICHPPDLTMEKWQDMMGDMIYGLKWGAVLIEDLGNAPDWARVERGLKAFSERYRDLWW